MYEFLETSAETTGQVNTHMNCLCSEKEVQNLYDSSSHRYAQFKIQSVILKIWVCSQASNRYIELPNCCLNICFFFFFLILARKHFKVVHILLHEISLFLQWYLQLPSLMFTIICLLFNKQLVGWFLLFSF